MNKIKKVWAENKVLFFLGIILVICLIIIGVIAFKSFYSSCNDNYCNRKVEDLRSELPNAIMAKLQENPNIVKSNVLVKNTIVYISATFKDDVALDDAKSAMNVVLPLFTEQELLTYYLDFTIKTENQLGKTEEELKNLKSGFTLLGARNTNGSGEIVWSNYNIQNEEDNGEVEKVE